MTVAWDDVKLAIQAFVQSAGVVADDHVVWDKDAAKLVLHESSVELRITGERSVGYDDVQDVEVEPGVFSPRVTGIREFVLSIRFRARTPMDAYAARTALETVRASFHHPGRSEILSEAGVAFLATEMLETRDVTLQGRWEQIAALDVRLSVVSELFAPEETAENLMGVGVSDNSSEPVMIGE